MNVSMMDSYNLSWKLIHTIFGLTPSLSAVLSTFSSERHLIANQLIAFDGVFSAMFSGKAHDNFHQEFLKASGFTSGCGIEYAGRTCTVRKTAEQEKLGEEERQTRLFPGRRILDVKLKGFADGSVRSLQDDLGSPGTYALLLMLPSQVVESSTSPQKVLAHLLEDMIPRFPHDMISPFLILPGRLEHAFEWTSLPSCVRRSAEMHTYVDAFGEAAKGYGVFDETGGTEANGKVVILRPDRVVGAVWELEELLMDARVVEKWLEGVLRKT